MSKHKTLTANKVIKENTIFALEVSEIGKAFLGTMVAKGTDYHGVSYQAKTEEEIREDFEFYKSGFLKLKELLNEGIESCVPEEKRITFKEARIMAGIHPAILAERLGISLTHYRRLENGEAKQGLSWSQAFIQYQSIYVKGMKMDFIEWKNELQKKPTARECDKAHS